MNVISCFQCFILCCWDVVLGVPHAKLTAKRHLLFLLPLVCLTMRNECVLCTQCFIYIFYLYHFFNTNYIHCPSERNVIAHTGLNKVCIFIVSYRIVSYRIVSYRIVSYRIVSYRIVSYRIVSYRIVLRDTILSGTYLITNIPVCLLIIKS